MADGDEAELDARDKFCGGVQWTEQELAAMSAHPKAKVLSPYLTLIGRPNGWKNQGGSVNSPLKPL